MNKTMSPTKAKSGPNRMEKEREAGFLWRWPWVKPTTVVGFEGFFVSYWVALTVLLLRYILTNNNEFHKFKFSIILL